MLVTILAAILLMAAYFLVLYGGVGFIQDKRFFSSAPKENLDAIPDKKERFRGGAHHRLDHRGDRGPAVSGRRGDPCEFCVPRHASGRRASWGV